MSDKIKIKQKKRLAAGTAADPRKKRRAPTQPGEDGRLGAATDSHRGGSMSVQKENHFAQIHG